MTRKRPACLLAAGALLTAAPAPAQTLVARAADASGRPVAGALATLFDSTGRQERTALTDSAGMLVIEAHGFGTYRLRLERIGHEAREIELRIGSDTAPLLLNVGAQPLPRVAVADEICGNLPAGTVQARLLAQTGLGLATARTAVEHRVLELSVEQYTARRPAGSARGSPPDSSMHLGIAAPWPFPVTTLTVLQSSGFAMESASGDWTWAVPDAAVLLSEWFQAGHCWSVSLEEPRDRPHLSVLWFTPRQGAGHLSGRFALDRDTWELRAIEWTYTRLPAELPRSDARGAVTFARSQFGPLHVQSWTLVVPMLARRYTGALVPLGTIERGGRTMRVTRGFREDVAP